MGTSLSCDGEWIHNLADSALPKENWRYIPDQWAYPAKLPASKGYQKRGLLLDKGQLIFSTGYGAKPGVLSYLAIDLSQTYTSVSELKHKVEIHPLFPSGK